MAEVNLRNVTKSFGAVHVIKGVDLDIRQGEFVVFVGPSGCGKSTLLRLIAGLEDITSGELSIGGDVVNEVPPSKRGIAMVFQSYALYPHMTVYNNMAFGMKLARASKEEIDKRVRSAANILQLTHLLDRLPKQLSGGQRQRVAIGRAIVRNPKVFLFDEPLSNLDAALRVATRIEIAKLHEEMADTTMIYVTHDQVEAMTLADRIVVLNGGLVEQVGSPMTLYHEPANLFVARFIGSPAMNIAPCTVEAANGASRVRADSGVSVRVPATIPASAVGQTATLGARPEDLRIATGGDAIFRGKLLLLENLGEVALLYVDSGNPQDPIIAKVNGTVSMERGTEVGLTVATEDLHVFDKDGMAFPRGRAGAATRS
jgi:ABC-type sugar transport system ATPase subunit